MLKGKRIYKNIHLEKLFEELQWKTRIHTLLYNDVFPVLCWSELKIELDCTILPRLYGGEKGKYNV